MKESRTSRKVLIVAYFFPPMGGGGVQRTVKFVKYLRDFGYEPVVLTVRSGEHTAWDESFRRDIPEDVRIIRTRYLGLPQPKKSQSKTKESAASSVSSSKKSFLGLLLIIIPYLPFSIFCATSSVVTIQLIDLLFSISL